MSKLNVPSLQHLARLWHEDPQCIKRTLINLVDHGPTFSYAPLYDAVRDLLVLHLPREQIKVGLERTKQEIARKSYSEILPLVYEHFDGIKPTFVQAVAPRFYPVSRDLMVPFQPPLVYGAKGRFHFPWFSFWRSNPLIGERLSLFVTVVEEVLLQDADLEDAEFTVLDFSAHSPRSSRQLQVFGAKDIPRVSDKRKMQMLAAFANGFELANAEISNRPQGVAEKPRPQPLDDDQLGLFVQPTPRG
jgi:hypothetical protein